MAKTSSLIKQLNESAEKLSLENKEIFDDIVVYMRTSNIKIRDMEEFLQQILDSFLNAEKQGVSIESMLGTTDIKHYCEEIVSTYKSSYNYLSLCSEYIMYTGMFIVILSFINYILQNFTAFMRHDADKFSFYLTFDLGLVSQFLLIGLLVSAIMTWVKKGLFKGASKDSKIKEFFILWILSVLFICIMVVLSLFIGEMILFKLNIFIVLIIGIILYFIGNYLSEK